MKAKKQKSGNWSCRYIDRYEIRNGKKVPVLGSVTRKTKKEAEAAAARLEGGNEKKKITLGDAVKRYIEIKSPVLSPSTLRAYEALYRNAYNDILTLELSELTGDVLQLWVSEYSLTHSPKATRNAYGLISAVLGIFAPRVNAKVTLPPKIRPDYYTPTGEDVITLLAYTKGTELEKAIILASMGTLRRGEICALTREDIVGDTIHINKSMVELRGGGTAVKAPKTPQSTRAVVLPYEAIERLTEGLAESERVVKLSPTAISNAFPDALKACGLPSFRFHDLRAFSASIRHDKGVPDVYILAAGGWSSTSVLHSVYRRKMEDRERIYTEEINKVFADFLQISEFRVQKPRKIKQNRYRRVGSNPTLSAETGKETL